MFTCVLQRLADSGFVKEKTIRTDAVTLEATAALRSIVRRERGETHPHDPDAKITKMAGSAWIA